MLMCNSARMRPDDVLMYASLLQGARVHMLFELPQLKPQAQDLLSIWACCQSQV